MNADSYKLFHEGILSLARAERKGFRIDVGIARAHRDTLTAEIDDLEKRVYKSQFYKDWQRSVKGTVNIDSNQQLAKYLYEVKNYKPVKSTASGKGSTDLEALEALNVPELSDMLEARKLKKLRDTYLESFLREECNGRIHPSYNLHNVTTYRSSSDSPNFQNIPIRTEKAKEIRKCLFASKGNQLFEADFSGIEVRIAACYHKDPTMLKYIRDPTTDMHRDMAKQIYCIKDFIKEDKAHKVLRYGAKNGFVFPQFYGDYYANNAPSLAKWAELPLTGKWSGKEGLMLPNNVTTTYTLKENGINSFNGFVDHIKKIENHFWTKRFSVYNEWRNKWWASYQKKGYMQTLTGFVISGELDRNQAINFPVQGSAFHCTLWSLNRMDALIRKMKWKTRIIGQVHDSIIFDLYPPEKEVILAAVREITTVLLPKHWKWIIVPLDIDAEICEVDESWYYKKEIKF